MATTTLVNPKTTRLDSAKATMILAHAHNSRQARVALMAGGFTIAQLADKTGLQESTVFRFLGMGHDGRNTRDPRTSTTVKIFQALGYDMILRRKA